MSGWIKMSVDLRTHPKVVRMSSALKADRLRVIGGLWAVWCLFDAHTEDGLLEGYTLQAVDDDLGWRGFGAAMQAVGWLEESESGLHAPRFEDHNGATAKRRAMETSRKGKSRKVSAPSPQDVPQACVQVSASDADKLRNREEEIREEEKDSGAHTATEAVDNSQRALDGHEPTKAGAICRAMRQAGLQSTNPGDPRLLALIEQGATEAEFVGIAAEAVEKRKGWAWVLAVLPARRADAAVLSLAPKTDPPRNDAAEQTADYLARQDAEFRANDTPENRERVAAAIADARNRLTGAQPRKVQ